MERQDEVNKNVICIVSVRSASQHPQQQLCEICKTIDLSSTSFAPPTNEQRSVVDRNERTAHLAHVNYTNGSYVLGEKATISERHACPLCRLVTRCIDSYPTYESKAGEFRIGWIPHGEKSAVGDD